MQTINAQVTEHARLSHRPVHLHTIHCEPAEPIRRTQFALSLFVLAFSTFVANGCSHELTVEPETNAPEEQAETSPIPAIRGTDAAHEAAQKPAIAANTSDAPSASVPATDIGTHMADTPDSIPSEMPPASDLSGANPAAPSGPSSDTPQMAAAQPRAWPEDCEERRVFRAHGASQPGDTSKYKVAADAQYAVIFYFDSPWAADVQLLAARPSVDNHAVVHHWVLWTLKKSQSRDGQVVGAPEQLYQDSDPVVAPLIAAGVGATDLEMPAGVGVRVGTSDEILFALEIHYVNLAAGQVEEDATGVEVCVTSHKRPEEAALHQLGRLNFELPAHAKTNVTSTCRPTSTTEPVHLTAVTPHMHRTGSNAKLVINRKSGEQITIHDQGFDYQEQRTYPVWESSDLVLNPGDTLTTTCTFDNTTDATIKAGERNENEMCRVFTLAWPAGKLNNGLPFGAVIGLPDELSCLEL